MNFPGFRHRWDLDNDNILGILGILSVILPSLMIGFFPKKGISKWKELWVPE
jgi:hypothetical protein